MQGLSGQKRALRAHFLALRAAIPASQRLEWDAALCRAVAETEEFARATLLLCYAHVNSEPDLTPLYELAVKRGKRIAFPRCEGTALYFHVVSSPDALTPGRFSIPEPPKSAPLAECDADTLCILPALSAAPDGTRLGYGGGFYDRFLPTFKGSRVLPIYDSQLSTALPREDTDFPVSLIITQKGVKYRA